MADLTNPRWIYFKGILFLLAGILAGGLLLVEKPTLKVAILLVIAIWCFCRFYYFAFYVIQHYVDPGYRFAGLWSFVRYLTTKERSTPSSPVPKPGPGRTSRDTSEDWLEEGGGSGHA